MSTEQILTSSALAISHTQKMAFFDDDNDFGRSQVRSRMLVDVDR
jgi:hypothetical protein